MGQKELISLMGVLGTATLQRLEQRQQSLARMIFQMRFSKPLSMFPPWDSEPKSNSRLRRNISLYQALLSMTTILMVIVLLPHKLCWKMECFHLSNWKTKAQRQGFHLSKWKTKA
uniref:Uncharacterized protein n=1 Tax=Opuntia streptacantha TaxID=393608 RepID=A0A7C9B099_OPUST